MEKWIEDLLALQDADLRIRRIAMRLDLLPKEKEKMENELGSARANLRETRENTKKFEREIKQVESEIKKFNEDIQKLQSQSVMVKKNEEYKALLNEVATCKNKIGDLETREIALLDDQAKVSANLKELEKNFAAKEKSVREEIQELDDLKAKLVAEIEKIKLVRNEREKLVGPEILPFYGRLLDTGRGQPLVPIHHGACGNCHLKLTPQTINQARKAARVNCDNCGYLIYFVEE